MDSELAVGGGSGLSLSESFDRGRDGGSDNAARPLFYTELLESVCPEYMAMGMSYDEFWNGSNDAPRMYRTAYRRQRERANEDAWLHGLYVQQAIAACFSDKKKPVRYPDKPIGNDDGDAGKRRPDEPEKPKQSPTEKARTLFEVAAIRFNAKFDERQKQLESEGKEVGADG